MQLWFGWSRWGQEEGKDGHERGESVRAAPDADNIPKGFCLIKCGGGQKVFAAL